MAKVTSNGDWVVSDDLTLRAGGYDLGFVDILSKLSTTNLDIPGIRVDVDLELDALIEALIEFRNAKNETGGDNKLHVYEDTLQDSDIEGFPF